MTPPSRLEQIARQAVEGDRDALDRLVRDLQSEPTVVSLRTAQVAPVTDVCLRQFASAVFVRMRSTSRSNRPHIRDPRTRSPR
jgi:hypothetical protein